MIVGGERVRAERRRKVVRRMLYDRRLRLGPNVCRYHGAWRQLARMTLDGGGRRQQLVRVICGRESQARPARDGVRGVEMRSAAAHTGKARRGAWNRCGRDFLNSSRLWSRERLPRPHNVSGLIIALLLVWSQSVLRAKHRRRAWLSRDRHVRWN